MTLILSCYPGIDALGLAFQREFPEACLVRGPDPIYGSLHDSRTFHPPAGVFWGLLGTPPCQTFSRMRHLNPLAGQCHGNLIPDFERIVAEAQPEWFVMENVPAAPTPQVAGYGVDTLVLNNRWLGEAQERTRRFSFGTRDGRVLAVEVALFEAREYRQAVTSSARAVPVKLAHGAGGVLKVKRTYTEANNNPPGPDTGPRAPIAEMLQLQGLPADFLEHTPFTDSGKRQAIGNAVPMSMGLAIARAVRRALGLDTVEEQAQ